MKYFALLVFFFYSATIYSTDNFTRTPAGTSVNASVPTVASTAMTAAILEDSIQQLYTAINLEKYDLSLDIFRYGMIGYLSLQQQGKLSDKNLLSIIDFTKPSTQKRFFTIDLNNKKVLYHTYVSHGRNTGENYAKTFSNKPHSNASSLGFFVTGETYVGSKGYSMRLDGMESGYNDKVRERAVVMHDADYVSEKWIKQYGRLGRSQGCPALPKEISKIVIDTIKEKTAVFAYYNDTKYLAQSAFLNIDMLLGSMNALAAN